MAGDEIDRVRSGGTPPPPRVPVPDAWRPPPVPEPTPDPGEPGPAGMWVAAIGAVVLAAVACIPHLVAPALAIIVSIVGLPIAWSMRRIATGRRYRLLIATALVLGLTIVLALVMPIIWIDLGVMPLPRLVWPGS